jgi:hypothetical protein
MISYQAKQSFTKKYKLGILEKDRGSSTKETGNQPSAKFCKII